MALVTMKELLEAGVHFGHQTRRWNPKMKPYIYHERNGIYIIDLHATLRLVEGAYEYVRNLAANGGSILFVGTKRQGQESIRESAERCGMPHVCERWLGGMMTNFDTIRKRVDYLHELNSAEERGEWKRLTKKEGLRLSRERDKLERSLGGIKDMRSVPEAMFVIDTRREETAVKEANILGMPVVAVIDTNSDPEFIDWPIPGNDDAIRAIRLFGNMVADAVIEGRSEYHQKRIDAASTPDEAASIALELGIDPPETDAAEVAEDDAAATPEAFEGAVEDQFIEEQFIELDVAATDTVE